MANHENDETGKSSVAEASRVADYEAPRVESVMTADDVEREALYAGRPSTI